MFYPYQDVTSHSQSAPPSPQAPVLLQYGSHSTNFCQNPQSPLNPQLAPDFLDSPNSDGQQIGQQGPQQKLSPSQKKSLKLFVGGLPSDMTYTKLLSVVKPLGSFSFVKVFMSKDSSKKTCLGFGHVYCKDKQTYTNLLSAQLEFEGKFLQVKKYYGSKKDAQFEQNLVARKVFVGNIPNKFSDQQLLKALQTFGPVESCYILKDNISGMNKRYGFGVFEQVSSALKAIQAGSLTLEKNGLLILKSFQGPKNAFAKKNTSALITNQARTQGTSNGTSQGTSNGTSLGYSGTNGNSGSNGTSGTNGNSGSNGSSQQSNKTDSGDDKFQKQREQIQEGKVMKVIPGEAREGHPSSSQFNQNEQGNAGLQQNQMTAKIPLKNAKISKSIKNSKNSKIQNYQNIQKNSNNDHFVFQPGPPMTANRQMNLESDQMLPGSSPKASSSSPKHGNAPVLYNTPGNNSMNHNVNHDLAQEMNNSMINMINDSSSLNNSSSHSPPDRPFRPIEPLKSKNRVSFSFLESIHLQAIQEEEEEDHHEQRSQRQRSQKRNQQRNKPYQQQQEMQFNQQLSSLQNLRFNYFQRNAPQYYQQQYQEEIQNQYEQLRSLEIEQGEIEQHQFMQTPKSSGIYQNQIQNFNFDQEQSQQNQLLIQNKNQNINSYEPFNGLMNQGHHNIMVPQEKPSAYPRISNNNSAGSQHLSPLGEFFTQFNVQQHSRQSQNSKKSQSNFQLFQQASMTSQASQTHNQVNNQNYMNLGMKMKKGGNTNMNYQSEHKYSNEFKHRSPLSSEDFAGSPMEGSSESLPKNPSTLKKLGKGASQGHPKNKSSREVGYFADERASLQKGQQKKQDKGYRHFY